MTVVGIQRKNGNFDNEKGENIAYDNIFLFLEDRTQDGFDGIQGTLVDKFKIPTAKFSDMFGGKLTPETSASLVGQNIDFVTSMRNGKIQVSGIRIVTSK